MKRAFLVGINAYAQSALRGCVNDVTSMASMLETQGFIGPNVKILKDRFATKAAILDGLAWLTANLKADDHIVFHYSGHGSQVSDQNRDESDYRDEIICPVDVFSGNYVTDDQLRGIFSQVPPTVTVDVFLDCCHSGTGLRDFVVEPEENDVVGGRYLDPSLFDSGLTTEEPSFSMRDFVLLQSNSVTLWSGCQDKQTSADAYIGGKYCGAFTYCLLEALKANPRVSRRQLDKAITAALKARRFAQIPQLETDAITGEKVLFS